MKYGYQPEGRAAHLIAGLQAEKEFFSHFEDSLIWHNEQALQNLIHTGRNTVPCPPYDFTVKATGKTIELKSALKTNFALGGDTFPVIINKDIEKNTKDGPFRAEESGVDYIVQYFPLSGVCFWIKTEAFASKIRQLITSQEVKIFEKTKGYEGFRKRRLLFTYPSIKMFSDIAIKQFLIGNNCAPPI